MWNTKNLDGPFGVEVVAADIARDIEQTSFQQLLDLLYEHHVLVIRRQELTKPQYSRFGHRWGEPIKFFKESHLDPEFPDLIRISN